MWLLGLFAFYIYTDLSGEYAEGFEVVGQDAWLVYAKGSQALHGGQSPYLQGLWANDKENYRYDPVFAALVWPLAELGKGGISVVFHLFDVGAIFLSAYLFQRLLKSGGWELPPWGWAVLLINTAVFETGAYANIDPLLLLVGIGLLLALQKRRWVFAGVLVAVLLSTKFFWLALLGYPLVRRDWRILLRSLGLGIFIHLAANVLVAVSLGFENGVSIYLGWWKLILGTPGQSILLAGPGEWANSSLHQIAINVLHGDSPLAGALALVLAVVLLGALVTTTINILRRNDTNNMRTALSYSFMGWLMIQALVPQVEYSALVAPILVFIWAVSANQTVRRIGLGGLPYTLSQFPTLVALFTGIWWLDWIDLVPTLVLGTVCEMIALIIIIQNPLAPNPITDEERKAKALEVSAQEQASMYKAATRPLPTLPSVRASTTKVSYPIPPGASPRRDDTHSVAIDVSGLSKTFSNNGATLQAVDHLTFSIAHGEVFSFLGPNGAGKTTTIKMICGLISPTAGTICLNGYDMARESRQALTQIGAVLEGARNVYWRLSAWENLLYFGRLRGCSGKTLQAAAEGLLRELGLWERRNDEVRLFSRGMQQKIAIASALVSDPSILLLDEPTLGLDVESAHVVESWVGALAHEHGKAVLLTTHQLDMAQRVADRVGIIRQGRLIADQSVADLLHWFQQPPYEVKVRGHLEKAQYPWLNDLTVSISDDEMTTIGGIFDQAGLYRLLDQLRDLNVPLLSVTQNTPDLEDVFLRLLYRGTQA